MNFVSISISHESAPRVQGGIAAKRRIVRFNLLARKKR